MLGSGRRQAALTVAFDVSTFALGLPSVPAFSGTSSRIKAARNTCTLWPAQTVPERKPG
jgi:hypothetical protein